MIFTIDQLKAIEEWLQFDLDEEGSNIHRMTRGQIVSAIRMWGRETDR